MYVPAFVPVGSSLDHVELSKLYSIDPPFVVPATINTWASPVYTNPVIAVGGVTVGVAFSITTLIVAVALS